MEEKELTVRELSRALISAAYMHLPKAGNDKIVRIATGWAGWESCTVVVLAVRKDIRTLPRKVKVMGLSFSAIYDDAVTISGCYVLPYAAKATEEEYIRWKLLER